MGKAIRHFFSHNFLLKVFSLLFSSGLWLIVVNIQNPISTATINNIPIQILNETYFEEQGKVVSVESELKLSVTVSGNRSVVEKATADDFRATIDYLSASTEEGKVRIQVTPNDRKLTITQQSASFVRLHIQNIITRELSIRVETNGDPAPNYIVAQEQSEMVVQPSSITVRGPEEMVNQIAEAVVVLNTENAKIDVSGKGKEIELLDPQGKTLEFSEDGPVSISSKMMTQLVVPVYKKFSIKLVPSFELVEDNPYLISHMNLSPSTLVVYGNELKLSPVTEISLPESILLEEAGQITRTYDLNILCQELASRISGKVGNLSGDEAVLNVTVVRREEASFELDESVDISLQNKEKGYEYEIVYPSVPIQVAGIKETIEALTIGSFHFEVDVEECKEDQDTEVDLIIKAPKNVTILNAPGKIRITKKLIDVPEENPSGTVGSDKAPAPLSISKNEEMGDSSMDSQSETEQTSAD